MPSARSIRQMARQSPCRNRTASERPRSRVAAGCRPNGAAANSFTRSSSAARSRLGIVASAFYAAGLTISFIRASLLRRFVRSIIPAANAGAREDMANALYYGDNLDVLRREIAPDMVDLVYLDPPFNSQANYNLLFKGPSGKGADAQIEAFEDTWHWGEEAERAFAEVLASPATQAAELLRAMRSFLGENDLMAYLAMMAVRLIELHRVLKPTGSLYLHCDPTAGHYLKILLDAIFGIGNFRTEIIWKRSSAHSDGKQGRRQHGRIHDTILFYTKTDIWRWNSTYLPYDREYADAFYRHIEVSTGRRYRLGDLTGPGGAAKGNPMYEVMGVTRYWRYSEERMKKLIDQGRVIQTSEGSVPQYKRYLDEMSGVPLQDIWTDLRPIGAQAQERLGYPTQKPVVLLERIISASSNPGDLVLDPFCGCGTTIHAAQKLGRAWIGIDVTHLAISLIERRLKDAFPGSHLTCTARRRTSTARSTSPAATSTSFSGGRCRWSMRVPMAARRRVRMAASTASCFSAATGTRPKRR